MRILLSFLILAMFPTACIDDDLGIDMEDVGTPFTLLKFKVDETPCNPSNRPAVVPDCTERFYNFPVQWFTGRTQDVLYGGAATGGTLFRFDTLAPNDKRGEIILSTHHPSLCSYTSTLYYDNVRFSAVGDVQAAPNYILSSSYYSDSTNDSLWDAGTLLVLQDDDITFAEYRPDTAVLYRPIVIIDCVNKIDSIVGGRAAGRFLLETQSPIVTSELPDTLVLDSISFQFRF